MGIDEEVAALKRIAAFHGSESKLWATAPIRGKYPHKYLFFFFGGFYEKAYLAENYYYASYFAKKYPANNRKGVRIVFTKVVQEILPHVFDRLLIGAEVDKWTPSSYRHIYSLEGKELNVLDTWSLEDIGARDKVEILDHGKVEGQL